MTELLRRWVNDDIKVSRAVKSFDADFCNGYLFGEILSRYGLLDPQVLATKFTNDHTPGCKMGNFTQVTCGGGGGDAVAPRFEMFSCFVANSYSLRIQT